MITKEIKYNLHYDELEIKSELEIQFSQSQLSKGST